MGLQAVALFGAPARNQEEIFAAIARYQDAVAAVGRPLAERYGFAYPEELEAMVRQAWAAFRASMARSDSM